MPRDCESLIHFQFISCAETAAAKLQPEEAYDGLFR